MPGTRSTDGLDAVGLILGDGTIVDIGPVADGEVLQRSGSQILGAVVDPRLAAEYYFLADFLENINPAGTDWAVNALSELLPDPFNNGIPVRHFDDSVEEGAGLTLRIPGEAGQVTFDLTARALATGGGDVQWNLYWREITDGAATGAWSAGVPFATHNFEPNNNWSRVSGTFDLSGSGLNAGSTYQFELTRDGTAGADDLVSDVLLYDIRVRFDAAKFRQYFAGHFSTPKNADWAVNAFAPEDIDDISAALNVRYFDDTDEEGVGFEERVPTWAKTLKLDFQSRAQATGGGDVALNLYYRKIEAGGTTGAWSSAFSLTDLTFGANTNWADDTQLIALSTLGIDAGSPYQFQLTRNGGDAGDTLVSDWLLHEMDVTWI